MESKRARFRLTEKSKRMLDVLSAFGTLDGKSMNKVDIINAAKKRGKIGAHIAPSLSLVEIVSAILANYNEGDTIVLSKGHGALGLYAALHQYGIINDEQFETFEENGGDFPGQPSRSDDNHI